MTLSIEWADGTPIVDAPGRPGLYCPQRFTATWGARDVQIDIDVENGQACMGFRYTADLGPGTYRDIARNRTKQAIDGACWAVEQMTAKDLFEARGRKVEVTGRPARARVTDEHLREVAEVYRTAERPHVAVAERFGLTQSNASQRIHEARRRGILEPSERGVAQPA